MTVKFNDIFIKLLQCRMISLIFYTFYFALNAAKKIKSSSSRIFEINWKKKTLPPFFNKVKQELLVTNITTHIIQIHEPSQVAWVPA